MSDILPYLPRGLRMLKMSIDKKKYSEENAAVVVLKERVMHIK